MGRVWDTDYRCKNHQCFGPTATTAGGGHRPVSVDTEAFIRWALEQEIVRESGLLVPNGRLGYEEAHDAPWSTEQVERGNTGLRKPWRSPTCPGGHTTASSGAT